ncbi:hypothetical protein V8G61_13370 [Gaetbulibacter sp. M240]|uniref:hypothetical protein n=1 Tax=Gaetbulibacter sp. M240 TaxID=3126511 RepID=UPI00374F3C0D
MSDKKNIDRLFQEGFKDFEVQPNDAVWKHIEAKLGKKKKRRAIPFWWPYAGVAALLALLLGLGYSYFNDAEVVPERNRIVNENPNTSPHEILEEQDQNKTLVPDPTNNLLPENTFSNEQQLASEKTSESKNALISEVQKSNANKSITQGSNTKTTPNNPSAVAGNESATYPSDSSDDRVKNLNLSKDSNAVTNNNPSNNPSAIAENSSDVNSKQRNDPTSALAENKPRKNNITNQDSLSGLAQNTTKSKQSIEEVLNDNKILEKEDDDDLSRWSVAANAAPVYFNSLGQGSAIDPQFNGNSKTGEVNMSYGISARYALNKKLRIRSGINKVALGYRTNDVLVFQSLSQNYTSGTLDFISKPGDVNLLGLGANDNTTLTSASSINSAKPESVVSNAAIDQTFGYIEIPVELEYALINKRIGFRVIGGFSTLFLSNNAVYTESESGRTYLGEANNMNGTSYSGNFGLGLSYGVTKKLDLNIEPLLKYQFNSFNRTAGDFQPFFIGVYTGLSIKF